MRKKLTEHDVREAVRSLLPDQQAPVRGLANPDSWFPAELAKLLNDVLASQEPPRPPAFVSITRFHGGASTRVAWLDVPEERSGAGIAGADVVCVTAAGTDERPVVHLSVPSEPRAAFQVALHQVEPLCEALRSARDNHPAWPDEEETR